MTLSGKAIVLLAALVVSGLAPCGAHGRPTTTTDARNGTSTLTFYNSANQRTRTTWADNSYWDYSYDSLGQVTSGRRLWSDGSYVVGQQFEYRYDEIGNRTRAASGGNEWGSNLRYAAYSSSQLNQITSRVVPGAVDITGSATNTATVTVWPSTSALPLGTTRKAEYYRAEVPITNASVGVWLTVTNLAVRNGYDESDLVTNFTGSIFVPKTPQAFLYDSDGNLTNDGRWTFSWDTENRLAHMGTGTSIATNARFGLEFKYDYQGRRISKVVSNWVGSGWNKLSERRFLYDGMNLIAVLDGSNTILQSFHWGTDLSGSMDGAGGVGGLLAMTVHTGSNAGTYFYADDGNGNVIGLVSAADGSIVAQYEYGPFGELLRATGSLAKENPFRFSSKYQDDETDLIYYGYRYYCASTGQWLNRDPFGEVGGLSLYAFAGSDGVNNVDIDGRWITDVAAARQIAFDWSVAGFERGGVAGWSQALAAQALLDAMDCSPAQLVEDLASRAGANWDECRGQAYRDLALLAGVTALEALGAKGAGKGLENLRYALDDVVRLGRRLGDAFSLSRGTMLARLERAGTEALALGREGDATARLAAKTGIELSFGRFTQGTVFSKADLVAGLEGVTAQSSRVAAAIRSGDIGVNILGPRMFRVAYLKYGGEAARLADTTAFRNGSQIYLRQGSSSFLGDAVHEGTHVLDAGARYSTRIREVRAYFYERAFNSAVGAAPPSKGALIQHILDNY